MSQRQPLTHKSVQSIMNKRVLIKVANAGKAKILFTVQGDGNTIDAKDRDGNFVMADDNGTILRKKIFNLQANSEVACQNPRNKAILIDAFKAEKAGKTEEADELYNDYLNKVQMSFSVFTNSPLADKITNGVDIAAKVQLIETENGRLLTIDQSTISIKEPEAAEAFSFDMSELTGMSDEELAALDAPATAETDKPKNTRSRARA